MLLADLYVISVDYFCFDSSTNLEFTERVFLGVEGPHKLLVFDKAVCYRTKIFASKKEAESYIKEKLTTGICFANPRVDALQFMVDSRVD